MLEDASRRLWAGVGLAHLDNVAGDPPLGLDGSRAARPQEDLAVISRLDAALDRLEALMEGEGEEAAARS